MEHYGGEPGWTDSALLESAAASPTHGTADGQFLHLDLWQMAAAYVFHLARNHAFENGNKRTAALAAIVFLDLNGLSLTMDADTLEALVLGVADGSVTKTQCADAFYDNTAIL